MIARRASVAWAAGALLICVVSICRRDGLMDRFRYQVSIDKDMLNGSSFQNDAFPLRLPALCFQEPDQRRHVQE